MPTRKAIAPAAPSAAAPTDGAAHLLKQYGCGPIEFTGTDNALYERHLLFDHVEDLAVAGARDRFEAVAMKLVQLARKRDPRLGVVPKPRKRRPTRPT